MPFSETVDRVIKLATAIRDYWDAELPRRHPKYPLVQPGEDDGPPPPEEAELRELLRSLPATELHKLVALMEIGRRVYPPSEFLDRSQTLRLQRPETEAVVAYLIGYFPLSDELLDGLEELAASKLDVDASEPSPV